MEVEWKILKANADTERAQLNRILSDIQNSITESATATLQQANVSATLAATDELNAFASAWRDTTALVYEVDGTVTSIAQDVVALSARVDDIETGESGNAEAIQLLTARVDVNEDDIAATASSVTDLETAINDPVTGLAATSAAVDTLESEVSTIDGEVSSNAAAITSLSVQTLAPNPNRINNPSGELGTAGWSGPLSALFSPASSDRYFRSDPAFSTTTRIHQFSVPAAPGDFTLSADMRVAIDSTGTFYMDIVCLNASGQVIANSSNTEFPINNLWGRKSMTITAPAGTDSALVRMVASQATFPTNWQFKRVKFEVGSVATSFSSDATVAQSASITQSLTASAGPGGAYAKATVMTDVNGRIAGTSLTNDGTEAEFAILADKFSIVSPGGGARTEYSSGNWRVYDAAGTLRVRMGVW